MTPDERYALQRARDALEDALATIKSIMDLGENPKLDDGYRARLKAEFGRCRCEFGWDSSCPRHRDPAALYVDDHQDERPDDGFMRSHFPAVTDNTLADTMSDEQIDRFLADPEKTRAHIDNHAPTPAEVFGKKDQ